MRFIIAFFILIYSFSSIADELLCDDGYTRNEYKINHFQVVECNCDCTMQNNYFYIRDLNKSYLVYEIFDISKVVGESGLNHQENVSSATSFFLKNKKSCKDQIKYNEKTLNFLILIPSKNSYCYEQGGVINNTGINQFNSDISMKIKSQIKVKKQYLYRNEDKKSKTKMYLIQGDNLEVKKKDREWLYILFKGKKDIYAWIPLSSVK